MNAAVYAAVFANSSVGMAVTTSDSTILEHNEALANLCRRNDLSHKIRRVADLLHPDDIDRAMERFRQLRAVGEQKSWLTRLNSPGRSVVWQFDVSVIGESAGEPLLLVSVRDVTLQKRTEQHLKRAKDDAERATRTKSAFLANMSHEIRTPIHTVTGMTELLTETALDEEQREYAEQIRFSADVLLFLINDILDFSKIEAGRLSLELIEVSLGTIVEESVEMISLQAHRKGVETIVHIGNGVPQLVTGDPGRLRQIIINLTNNAVKFTATGEIAVRVSTVGEVDGTATVRVEVRDSGIGIPPEKQGSLFSAFSQVDSSTTRKFGGSGLGLSICNSLVGMMAGSIGVESTPGTGSTFWFEIPFEVLEPCREPDPVLEGKRVLLVDDNKLSSRAVIDYLQRLGAAVESVDTGEEAVHQLLAAAGAAGFDLVLVDLELPGMDGWQLASRITAEPSIADIPRILMSPKGLLAGEAKMKRLRWFQGYISKPVSLDEFFEATRSATLDVPELEALDDEPAELLEEISYSSARIVVAEDHMVNQQLFRTILEKLGHQVILATDGKEAIEAARAVEVDLIFMDVQMPNMNGYEASAALREQGFDRPIVAVTANAVKGERDKCLAAGMNDFLTKPFKKKDLVTLLDRWLVADRSAQIQSDPVEQIGDPKEPEDPAYGDPEFPVSESMLGRPLQPLIGAPIDLDAARERFMGKDEILQKVVAGFLGSLASGIEQMELAVETADLEQVRAGAHTIKGGAWSLEATPLGNAAALLEASAKAGWDAHCRHYLADLRAAAEELKAALSDTPVTERTE